MVVIATPPKSLHVGVPVARTAARRKPMVTAGVSLIEVGRTRLAQLTPSYGFGS